MIYTISVYNQGSVDATNVSVIDYVPSDLIYDVTAALNTTNGWGVGPNPTTTVGSIAAGATTSVQIALRIDPSFQGTNIINDAEIASADNVLGLDDEDSMPNDNSNDPSEIGSDNDLSLIHI